MTSINGKSLTPHCIVNLLAMVVVRADKQFYVIKIGFLSLTPLDENHYLYRWMGWYTVSNLVSNRLTYKSTTITSSYLTSFLFLRRQTFSVQIKHSKFFSQVLQICFLMINAMTEKKVLCYAN